MEQGKRKFIISVSLVAILNLALLFSSYFLISAAYQKRKDADVVKASISINEKRIESTKQLEEEIAASEEERNKIGAVFLDKNNLIKFVEELESFARIAGVDIEIRAIEMGAGDSEVRPSFHFVASGVFSEVYRFLILLENDRYQTKIERFRLQNLSKGGNWEAEFFAELLSFKQI